MKRILLILIGICLLALILIEEGVIKRKIPYVQDTSMIGEQFEDIRSEWSFIHGGADNFFQLDDYFTRWKKGDEYLIAVFKNQCITDYLIFDSSSHTWKGTVSDTLSTHYILSQIGADNPPPEACDLGSGVSIPAFFSCDGNIVVWAGSDETIIYDALTLKRRNVYFIYRLIHGLLI